MSKIEQDLIKDIRELRSQFEYASKKVDGAINDIAVLDRNVGNLNSVITLPPPAPVSNLLYNGEMGHSVNSWFESVYDTGDKGKAAAHWFSHDGTLSGLTLDATDERTSSTAKSLKESRVDLAHIPPLTQHTGWNPDYSRWNSVNGWAEFNGTTTIDQPLPANYLDATTPLARVSLIAAKRHRFIEIPETSRMFAGIYDNTAGQLKFLTGSLGFTAVRVGAAGTTERRFKIHVKSDRGYEIVSPEVIILDAPSDAQFSATRNISFAWKQTAGQLRVDIYEYLPATAEYRLVAEISSGYQHIYQGSYLDIVSGYPVATADERTAIYYTRTGEMSGLATDGVSPTWDTVNFPIQIPDNYNKANTTGRQWLRTGFTVAANLRIENVTADGSNTIVTGEPIFDADYWAEYAGLTAQVYASDGTTLLYTTTVTSITDASTAVLGTTIAAGTNLIVRIVAGGFRGVFIDKVHLGFQQNTSYAPNPLDVRLLQPLAAPSSSSQGGSGGGTGGGIYCVKFNTPVKQADSTWKWIKNCNHGEYWASGEFQPNLLIKNQRGLEFTRVVRSANGCFVEATDSERFFVDQNDLEGTPLHRLRVGDLVMTEIDGRLERSRLIEISAYSTEKQEVYTPQLSKNRLFIAGKLKRSRWQRFFDWLRFSRKVRGGFVLHNRKQNEFEPITF